MKFDAQKDFATHQDFGKVVQAVLEETAAWTARRWWDRATHPEREAMQQLVRDAAEVPCPVCQLPLPLIDENDLLASGDLVAF